jgi:type VI protein secretion system component Hcp
MHRTFLFLAIVLGLLAAPAMADGSFVKIGDIKGTATEPQHQGWIQIGTWGSGTASGGVWLFGSAKPTFWFEKRNDTASAALQRALQEKTFYDRVLFDVSIKGDILRTTFFSVRVIAVETHGPVEKITLQFKNQTDQSVNSGASQH